MATVTRYEVAVRAAGVTVDPAASGPLVRFADVEEALHDADRLEWLLPVIGGKDDDLANGRTAKLATGIVRGLRGRALVDFARGLP